MTENSNVLSPIMAEIVSCGDGKRERIIGGEGVVELLNIKLNWRINVKRRRILQEERAICRLRPLDAVMSQEWAECLQWERGVLEKTGEVERVGERSGKKGEGESVLEEENEKEHKKEKE